jgi:hypothetical protein
VPPIYAGHYQGHRPHQARQQRHAGKGSRSLLGRGRSRGLYRVCVGDELRRHNPAADGQGGGGAENFPCRTCVTSVPAGIRTGAVADLYGALVNGRGARVGHFANVITQVTPRELLADVTLVLGQGQITAQAIEPAGANGSTIAITGGLAGTSPLAPRSASATPARP